MELLLMQVELKELLSLTPLLNSGVSTILLLLLIFRTIPSVLAQRDREMAVVRQWAQDQIDDTRNQYEKFIDRMEKQKQVEFQMFIDARKAESSEITSHMTTLANKIIDEIKPHS